MQVDPRDMIMQERFFEGRSALVISRGARAQREFSVGMSAGL